LRETCRGRLREPVSKKPPEITAPSYHQCPHDLGLFATTVPFWIVFFVGV
jgi:hypothetical protein